MKKEKDPRYAHDDLPPVKNVFLYAFRCVFKIVMIAYFGSSSFLLSLLVFPIFRILFRKNFTVKARACVKFTFWYFIKFIQLVRLSSFSLQGKEILNNATSKIIVANHPSILDVVYLIAVVPNADCIVRGGLMSSPMAGVIRNLYIVNTIGVDEMLEKSTESLKKGANLIIFPEGTRTPRHGLNPYKRGAARIALKAQSDVIPVYFGGNDKYGIGKHDPFFSYNHSGKCYHYDIRVLDTIKIQDYASLEPQIAARHLTEEMHRRIAAKALEVDKRIL